MSDIQPDDKVHLRTTQFKHQDFRKAKQTLMRRICVMVAYKDGAIGVRDSKDVDQNTLIFNEDEWNIFVEGVKNGEFDLDVLKVSPVK